MIIPVELASAPKSVREQIRNLLLSAPVTIVSATAPTLGPDAPATLWLNSETGDVSVIHGGNIYGLGGDALVKSPTPPTDTDLLWIDTTDHTINYYDGSVWVVLAGGSSFSSLPSWFAAAGDGFSPGASLSLASTASGDGSVSVGYGANGSSYGAAVGRSANGSSCGAAVGNGANGSSCGAAVGNGADGRARGAALGRSAVGFNNGAAVGFGSNGYNYGAAVGHGARGFNYGTAMGSYASGSNSGATVGANSDGSNYGAAVGNGADGSYYGVAMGSDSCGRHHGVAVGVASCGAYGSVAVGENTHAAGRSVAVGSDAWADEESFASMGGRATGTSVGLGARAMASGTSLPDVERDGLTMIVPSGSVAVGVDASASSESVAIGAGASAEGGGVAVGFMASAPPGWAEITPKNFTITACALDQSTDTFCHTRTITVGGRAQLRPSGLAVFSLPAEPQPLTAVGELKASDSFTSCNCVAVLERWACASPLTESCGWHMAERSWALQATTTHVEIVAAIGGSIRRATLPWDA